MNSKQFEGLPIISIADGTMVGSVAIAWLDPEAKEIAAFSVPEGTSLLGLSPMQTRWLVASDIHAVGPDALMVADSSRVVDAAPEGDLRALSDFLGCKVMTEGGEAIGQLVSFDIEDHGLRIMNVEVSPGFFKSNRMVPREQVINLGQEVIIVQNSVVGDPAAEGKAEDAGRQRYVVGDVTADGRVVPRTEGNDADSADVGASVGSSSDNPANA